MVQPQVSGAEPGQRVGLALTIADLAEQVQGFLVIADRLLVPALPLPDPPQIAERACLAEMVTEVTEDAGGFLLVVGGLLVVAQLRLRNAYVAQRVCRARQVGCRTEQIQRLPVVISSLLKTALQPVDMAELVEGGCLGGVIAGGAGRQRVHG